MEPNQKSFHVVVVTDCTDFASLEIELALMRAFGERSQACNVLIAQSAPFSTENAAFILRQLAENAPDGTIFFPVVNGERREQRRLIARSNARDYVLIGRDTGALDWLLAEFPPREIYEIVGFDFKPFGGRTIYPEILSLFLDKGATSDAFKLIEKFEIEQLGTQNKIVHIDNFGNCKIHHHFDKWPAHGSVVEMGISRQRCLRAKVCTRVMSEAEGQLLIYPGSSLNGLTELAINRGSAAEEYDLRVGDRVDFAL
jgi:S-adenosylmethionine hydrolase